MLHVCAYQVMSVRSILHVRSNKNVHGMRYGVEVICTHIHVNKLTHVYKLKQAIHQHIKKKIKRREKTYLHTLLIDKALGKYACMNTLPVLSSSLSVFVLLWPQDVDQGGGGAGGVAGADLGFWHPLPGQCLPHPHFLLHLHHPQHPAGALHLHLPLSPE